MRDGQVVGQGSGFIVSPDGKIVTTALLRPLFRSCPTGKDAMLGR
jgi:hypothetical protein